MKDLKKLLAIVILVLIQSIHSQANVTLLNGNFYIGYTDIIFPGGFEPMIERVYNSKSPFKGMFGHGWGSRYDVYLTREPDGALVIHEYGSGADNRFVPEEDAAELVEKQIDAIIRSAEGYGTISSDAEASAMRSKLKSEPEFLDRMSKYYRAEELNHNATVFHSTKFGYQYITRTSAGYIRTFDTGRYEHFDQNGHLTRVSDPNNNFIKLSYDSDGKISRLVDNLGRLMIFTVNNRGLIEKIRGENKECIFRYNNQDELIYSKDSDGNVYEYGYSDDGYHNLTKISYRDGTTMEVAYHDRDKFQNVKSVKERDGSLTLYDYSFLPGSLKLELTAKKKDGSIEDKVTYEFFYKSTSVLGVYKRIKTRGSSREVIEMDDEGRIVSIVSDTKNVHYTHDDKGRVSKKETLEEIIEIAYDEKIGKMILATYRSKANQGKVTSNRFTYDLRGNLEGVETSAGKSVKLKVDDAGRVTEATFNDQRQIQFIFNEGDTFSTEILLTAGGRTRKIMIEYPPGGEPRKKGDPQDIKEIEAIQKELAELTELASEARKLNDECNVCTLDSIAATP